MPNVTVKKYEEGGKTEAEKNQEMMANMAMWQMLMNSGGDNTAFMTDEQRRQQAGVLGAASIFDIFAGGKAQKEGEAQIEEGGATRDAVLDAIKAINQRDFSELTPEAERNAAIILKDKTPPSSDELAIAEMALRSGADPSRVQRALSESTERREAAEDAREASAFREGMQQARIDEEAAIRKLMHDYGLDYQLAQEMIQMGQQRSLMGQQQSSAGWRNATNAAMRYLTSGGGEEVKGWFNKDKEGNTTSEYVADDPKLLEAADWVFNTPDEDPADYAPMFGSMSEDDFLQSLQNAGFAGFEPGGVYVEGEHGMVVKTPGEFSHQTNPIDIIQDGAKIGEMTGGEYVINPEQAAGMEDAYNKAKKNPSKKNLLSLFEAVRFIDQPQFD
jgi:hypothetical protein